MALFGYQNVIDAGGTTLTPSSAADGFSVENLRIPLGASSAAWQTAFGTITASLLITAASAVAWRVAALARTNLTSGATIRVRVGDPATITSAPIYDSGVVSAGVVFGIGQALHIMPAAITALAMQIDIADTANPDMLLNIPLCYAGPTVEANISKGTDYAVESRRDDIETRGGVIFASFLSRRRSWMLKFDAIRDADIAWLDALETVATQAGNILFVPRTASARASSETILGILTPGRRGFMDRTANFRSWSASIVERL